MKTSDYVGSLLPLLWLILLSGCDQRDSREKSRLPQLVDPLTIVVTGIDFKWHARNPGLDSTLGTPDDIQTVQRIHVPTASKVRLELHSEDYLYIFSVPEQNLREIAMPNLIFTLDFELQGEGEYELICEQVCGRIRQMVLGRLVAMSPTDYLSWMKSTGKTK